MSEPTEKDYELAHTLVFSGRAHPDVAVARALAAAREEGRRAGLEEALAVCIADAARRRKRFARQSHGTAFCTEAFVSDEIAKSIRALIPQEPAPATFGGLVQKAADEVKSWPEWKQRSTGVAPSQDGEREDGER